MVAVERYHSTTRIITNPLHIVKPYCSRNVLYNVEYLFFTLMDLNDYLKTNSNVIVDLARKYIPTEMTKETTDGNVYS